MHCKDVHELCLEHLVTAVDCMKQVISTSHMCGHCLFDLWWDLAAAGKVMRRTDICRIFSQWHRTNTGRRVERSQICRLLDPKIARCWLCGCCNVQGVWSTDSRVESAVAVE